MHAIWKHVLSWVDSWTKCPRRHGRAPHRIHHDGVIHGVPYTTSTMGDTHGMVHGTVYPGPMVGAMEYIMAPRFTMRCTMGYVCHVQPRALPIVDPHGLVGQWADPWAVQQLIVTAPTTHHGLRLTVKTDVYHTTTTAAATTTVLLLCSLT